jgi:hypothetical protein
MDQLPPPPPPPEARRTSPPFWRRWWFWVIVVAAILIAQVDNVLHLSDAPASKPTAAPTVSAAAAAEQKICDDLRAGEPDSVIYADAVDVSQHHIPIGEDGYPTNVSIEALAFMNSVDGIGLKSVEWERAKVLSWCEKEGV